MNLRALKIIVVVMGVMLVAGFITLVVVIAGRFSRGAPARPVTPAAAAAPIEVPAGARIETMTMSGDRLVLAILLPDGDRQLVVIDLGTGRPLATIPLQTAH